MFAGKNKRLRIMAGPNGSGKSTILREVRNQFYCGPFVNADEIEKLLQEKKLINLPANYDLKLSEDKFREYMSTYGLSWQKKAKSEGQTASIRWSNSMLVIDELPSGYDAAIAADCIRYGLLQNGATFTFETVLSHASKINFLEQARQMGYKNYLYFICTIDPAINIERVRQRVATGGHAVSEEKVQKRYYESLELLPSILPLCHRVFLFDNSTEERSQEAVAEIAPNGSLEIRTKDLPWWVEKYVIQPLYQYE